MGKSFDPRPIDDWVIANLSRFDPYYKGPKSKLSELPSAPEPQHELDPKKTEHDLGYHVTSHPKK